MSDETVKAPALGISFSALGGALVFQTHVDQATSATDLNALIDKFDAVGRRQQAKADLVQLEDGLAKEELSLTNFREQRKQVETRILEPQEGRRTQGRADQQKLEQDRANADVTEKRFAQVITGYREKIAEAKAIIADEG